MKKEVKMLHPKVEIKNGQVKPPTAVAKPNVVKPGPPAKK